MIIKGKNAGYVYRIQMRNVASVKVPRLGRASDCTFRLGGTTVIGRTSSWAAHGAFPGQIGHLRQLHCPTRQHAAREREKRRRRHNPVGRRRNGAAAHHLSWAVGGSFAIPPPFALGRTQRRRHSAIATCRLAGQLHYLWRHKSSPLDFLFFNRACFVSPKWNSSISLFPSTWPSW